MFDIMQEIGRAVRVPDGNYLLYSYYLSYPLEGFMYLCENTMNPNNKCIDEPHRSEQALDL